MNREVVTIASVAEKLRLNPELSRRDLWYSIRQMAVTNPNTLFETEGLYILGFDAGKKFELIPTTHFALAIQAFDERQDSLEELQELATQAAKVGALDERTIRMAKSKSPAVQEALGLSEGAAASSSSSAI